METRPVLDAPAALREAVIGAFGTADWMPESGLRMIGPPGVTSAVKVTPPPMSTVRTAAPPLTVAAISSARTLRSVGGVSVDAVAVALTALAVVVLLFVLIAEPVLDRQEGLAHLIELVVDRLRLGRVSGSFGFLALGRESLFRGVDLLERFAVLLVEVLAERVRVAERLVELVEHRRLAVASFTNACVGRALFSVRARSLNSALVAHSDRAMFAASTS